MYGDSISKANEDLKKSLRKAIDERKEKKWLLSRNSADQSAQRLHPATERQGAVYGTSKRSTNEIPKNEGVVIL